MNLSFSQEQAIALGHQAHQVAERARLLASFGETEPELASASGVEIGCLEARTILSGGAASRIIQKAQEAERTRRNVVIESNDIDQISRLGGVLSTSEVRIAHKESAMAESESPLASLGSLIGIATGVAGLIKTFF